MTDPSTHDHLERTAVERPASVTATQLGGHLGLTRQRVGVLADVEHVIERLPNGRFNQDDCRLRYLRWLRDPARRSARPEAAATYAEARTQLLRIRIEEKQRKLVPRGGCRCADRPHCRGHLDRVVQPACAVRAPRGDLAIRRSIERVVFEVRTEIAAVCREIAAKNGEPLDL